MLTNDFERIVTEQIPLIDVRAPIEYEKGTFLNSVNLPIMSDEERHIVGICYKEKGNEEAVKLGYQLVSGKIKQERIDAWISHLNKYPNSIIYCFRGGSRSRICQEWLYEATGKKIPRIEGGYKAFRNYLISNLDPKEQKSHPILLGGYTGSGKTQLLKKLNNSIDLEAIANHRGSVFGNYVSSQPTQINFENNLAYSLIKNKNKYMIIEDESSNIGKCFIPRPLFEYFSSGELVILDIPYEDRVYNTFNEYVVNSQDNYLKYFGDEQGLNMWFNYINNSINKMKKRLGGDRYKRLMDSFELAYKEQIITGNKNLHNNWIEILLKEYYDPMYLYQLQKTTKKIIFKGNTNEVFKFLNDSYKK